MAHSMFACRAALAAAALLVSAPLAGAMPHAVPDPGAGPVVEVRDQLRHRRSTYRVNRYGYGHYVRGPNGSYGPYRAGSGAAFVYKQKHNRLCQTAPSRC